MSILEITHRSYSNDDSIEKLFKAIYLLQEVAGAEDEVVSLSKKLEEQFENIKEKNGVKIYDGNYKYWPNGLCEMTRVTYVKIVLSPWDNKSKFKEKSEAKDYKELRERCGTWSRQLRQLIGRQYRVDENDQIDAKKFYESYQKIESLDEASKALIDMKKIQHEKRELGKKLLDWLRSIDLTNKTGDYYSNRYSGIATFLCDAELMQIKDLLDKDIGWGLEYNLKKLIESFSQKTEIVFGRVEIDYKQFKDLDIYKIDPRYESLFDYIYSQILKIEDENVKTILKKMKII